MPPDGATQRRLLWDHVRPGASRAVKMRWLRRLRVCVAVAMDAFHRGDVVCDDPRSIDDIARGAPCEPVVLGSWRAAAIGALCGVVCLEHAIALTGGGEITDTTTRDPTSGILIPRTTEEWAAIGPTPPDNAWRHVSTYAASGPVTDAQVATMIRGLGWNVAWTDEQAPASVTLETSVDAPPAAHFSADDLVALGERMADAVHDDVQHHSTHRSADVAWADEPAAADPSTSH